MDHELYAYKNSIIGMQMPNMQIPSNTNTWDMGLTWDTKINFTLISRVCTTFEKK